MAERIKLTTEETIEKMKMVLLTHQKILENLVAEIKEGVLIINELKERVEDLTGIPIKGSNK